MNAESFDRLAVAVLMVGVVVLAGVSAYLFVRVGDLSGPTLVEVTSSSWQAVWKSNGTNATFPGVGSDYLGSCWNLSGPWTPGRQVGCDLQFDSGAFGQYTPASERWGAVTNVSVGSPFHLAKIGNGYFGAEYFGSNPSLAIIVAYVVMPVQPGDYAFHGVVLVA